MQKHEGTREQLSPKTNSTTRDLNNIEEEEVSNTEFQKFRRMINDLEKETHKLVTELKEDMNKQLKNLKKNSNKLRNEIKKTMQDMKE
jgi:phage host-nuclease inhibitor protein Gam